MNSDNIIVSVAIVLNMYKSIGLLKWKMVCLLELKGHDLKIVIGSVNLPNINEF